MTTEFFMNTEDVYRRKEDLGVEEVLGRKKKKRSNGSESKRRLNPVYERIRFVYFKHTYLKKDDSEVDLYRCRHKNNPNGRHLNCNCMIKRRISDGLYKIQGNHDPKCFELERKSPSSSRNPPVVTTSTSEFLTPSQNSTNVQAPPSVRLPKKRKLSHLQFGDPYYNPPVTRSRTSISSSDDSSSKFSTPSQNINTKVQAPPSIRITLKRKRPPPEEEEEEGQNPRPQKILKLSSDDDNHENETSLVQRIMHLEGEVSLLKSKVEEYETKLEQFDEIKSLLKGVSFIRE